MLFISFLHVIRMNKTGVDMALDMLSSSSGFLLSISMDLLHAPGQITDFFQASIFLPTHIISYILCHEIFKDYVLLCLYSEKKIQF